MDVKTIGTVAIGVVIAALLTAMLVIPIIDSSTQHNEQELNEDIGHPMSAVTELELVKTDDGYTYNGEALTNDLAGATDPYIVTDVFVLRGSSTDGVVTGFVGYGLIGNGGAPFVMSAAIQSVSMNNGEWTIEYQNLTYTGTYTFAYCFDKDGTYIDVTSGSQPHINANTSIITFRDNSQNYGVGQGTASHMTNLFQVTSGTQVTDYVESVTTVDAGDGSETVTNASGRMIIPTGYTIIVDNTDPASELLDLIPLLIVVGIIMGTVGLFVLRRE